MDPILELTTKHVVTSSLDEVKKIIRKNISISIPREELSKLEEIEIFSEATKEGFPKEDIQKLIETIFDYFLENIDLEKISTSSTMTLLKLLYLNSNFDLRYITSHDIFEFLDSHGYLEDFYSPKFKKEFIFSQACNIVVEKRNISFNTAIKRAIKETESDKFLSSRIDSIKKRCLDILEILNPLIAFYLEYENIFISDFLKKEK